MRAGGAVLVAVLLGSVLAAAEAAKPTSLTAARDGRELLQALHNADEARAAALIASHAAVNIRDEMGSTPLMWAAQRLDVSLTKQLLGAGADPNLCAGEGLCPLHIA